MNVVLFCCSFCSDIESETKYGAERDGCYYIPSGKLNNFRSNFSFKTPDIRRLLCVPLGGLGSGGLFSVYLERFRSPISKSPGATVFWGCRSTFRYCEI